MNSKVNHCYAFFTKIRLEREKNARMIIRFWTLKYFLKKKAKKLAEIARKKALADKKAADAAKKKGKYGYSGKKKVTKKPAPKKATDTAGKTADSTTLSGMQATTDFL